MQRPSFLIGISVLWSEIANCTTWTGVICGVNIVGCSDDGSSGHICCWSMAGAMVASGRQCDVTIMLLIKSLEKTS